MMKRLLLLAMTPLLLTFCFQIAIGETPESLSVGSSFFFGSYEQDGDDSDGSEPIEWVVLDVQENRALLASRYALDCLPFHDAEEDATWADCTLRAWLNDDFLNSAFTDAEREIIQTTDVPNAVDEGNAEWDVADLGPTQDHIFLLSYRELAALCPEREDRKIEGTETARDHGAKFLGLTSIGIGETDWWLRSPGEKTNEASCVNVRGAFDSRDVTDEAGVRPTLWIELGTDSSSLPSAQYAEAVSLFEAARYAEAADLFEALGNYSDSASRARECRYQQATEAYNGGDYDGALTLFEALDGYSDSYLLARACRYQRAVACQEAGDYETAIELFGEAGQYEDSMERLRNCYEQSGVSVYFFTADAVNAGFDDGYSKSKAITGDDRHFGWRMGRFFMSGFTRTSTDDAGNPLFIKTLGDNLTLWFDLEQDIDCLNGNEQLCVAEDTNGYDEAFGVQKTNFGRGTLIVRHTDYQNAQSDPILYTDYLLAKGTSGANTRVVLQEEGDYEVALDYELRDDEITHIANKYGNYRVLLRFSIRNGNCMVYPFDALTGAELQNTAVTENGFYLDLARSRYLDINVKRSVLIEGATGIVEDERFNRPAKDGDMYTQEGIYTISVSNRYTGESTTKTLFVGSDELLQEYVANGFSMDALR